MVAEFDSVVRKSVVDGLGYICGESGLAVFQKKFKLDEIAADEDKLDEGFQAIFGRGSWVLERAILKELYAQLGERLPEAPKNDYPGLVKAARRGFAMAQVKMK